MKSDKSIYYFYKYFPIVFGAFFLILTIFGLLFPEKSTFNGVPGSPPIEFTLVFILVGLSFILMPFFYSKRLVLVELNNQNIRIKKGGKLIVVNWDDIENISMVIGFYPPIYKIRLKNYADYFLFNTSQSGLHIFGFTWDWSDMGKLIGRKKDELRI